MKKLILIVLLTGCGRDENCLNQEQAIIKCLDKKIDADPSSWLLPYQRQECETKFPSEACYHESDI